MSTHYKLHLGPGTMCGADPAVKRWTRDWTEVICKRCLARCPWHAKHLHVLRCMRGKRPGLNFFLARDGSDVVLVQTRKASNVEEIVRRFNPWAS